MRLNLCVLVFCSMLFCGCGAGEDTVFVFQAVSGTWSGQMFQAGGLNCSDGQFFGAGQGTATREVSVQISGGGLLGEQSVLILDDCEYTGTRTAASEISFSSSDKGCYESVSLSSITNKAATLFINKRPPVPDAEGQPTCVSPESGEVSLQA